jgi:hypothetical protein
MRKNPIAFSAYLIVPVVAQHAEPVQRKIS